MYLRKLIFHRLSLSGEAETGGGNPSGEEMDHSCCAWAASHRKAQYLIREGQEFAGSGGSQTTWEQLIFLRKNGKGLFILSPYLPGASKNFIFREFPAGDPQSFTGAFKKALLLT